MYMQSKATRVTVVQQTKKLAMAQKFKTCSSFSATKLLSCLSLLFFVSLGDDQEKLVLLDIKAHWSSAAELSSSWNNSSPFCNWFGIQCSDGSVTKISLSNINVSGTFPSSICNLQNLSYLDLSDNNIHGQFPTSLYNCTTLRYLNLAQNIFEGVLPDDMDKMSSQLAYLDLSSNNLSGDIPPSIGKLLSLRTLSLHSNLFNGLFPAELGNLSELENFMLAYNPFARQRIPSEFGNMRKLKFLFIKGANLVGEIPETLGKLSELGHLDLANNYLNGSIPAAIWSLEKLRFLYLFSNNLTSEIKVETMASSFMQIDISMNQLEGPIPEEFGKLSKLEVLLMYCNQLSGAIPEGIGLLPNLTVIRLYNNQFTGVLPPELGQHSALEYLEVSNNRISGSLPAGLCAKGAFYSLVAPNNSLTGELSPSLANCSTLYNIMVQNNRLTGDFPTGIWSASVDLYTVLIHDNHFTGSLPDKLPRNLTHLEMDNNKFSGNIPSNAPSLQSFKASNNGFFGHIPTRLTGISNLVVLSLAGNRISGSIPDNISTLRFLTTLDLSNNMVSGGIPAALGLMPVLNTLNLSHNRISGSIPPEIGNLKLAALDLSFNQLSGEVPLPLQSQGFEQSFSSNPGLCSAKVLAHLNICARRSDAHDEISRGLMAGFLALGGSVLLMIIVMAALVVCRPRSHGGGPPSWKLTYFRALDFDVDDILRGLTDDNLIGSGGSGQVYKINLGDRTVAVKKMWNKNLHPKVEKTFEAEANILGSIRHANIVSLLCCIVSGTAKLLVYEYMENESLDQWLHGIGSGRVGGSLDWEKRLKIAIDVAKGLNYMHNECQSRVMHRDVKSSNILLDSEFRAKIADFGLARIWAHAGELESASTVAGTFGYMAPEYNNYPRTINEKVDVYSYGVVLLELTTGKRAQDGGEYEGLAGWAARCLGQNYMPMEMMIDCELRSRDARHLDKIVTVLSLGVECTRPKPWLRPSMKVVLDRLMDCDPSNEGRPHLREAPSLHLNGWRRGKSLRPDGEEEDTRV